MIKVARRYPEKTIKLLFGSCGNQCAYPDCTNPIIASETPYSDAAVVGQICHIYAAADDGPRGKPGLTEKARNALDNLILMCGHHHPLVDKQWETYPAETLKAWKKAHEAKYQQGTTEAAKLHASMQQLAFVQAYSDQQINDEVERIRKGRLLVGFPVKDAAMALATRVDTTELAGGSSEVRARALAWCARLLSQGDTAVRAQDLLQKSKALHACDEASLAEAFMVSATDRNQALAMLARSNTPTARSAALRIVTNCEQAKGAVSWIQGAGLKLDDFDAEGKFVYLMTALGAEEWQRAIEAASEITEEDFKDTPVLYHAVAMASLIQAAPEELRASLMTQVPFEAGQFPLASDEAALGARRNAASLFSKVSDFAQSMGVAAASNLASDYALWLKLRDPRDRNQGLDELRSSMRDPTQSLRRLNLALRFGIQLDLMSIEREIDQRVALSGKGTADEAFARLSLVFAQKSPREAAEYIAKHRDQLYEHLLKSSIQTFEIELLARASLIGTANEMLAKASAEGLGEREQQNLRRIIAECETADPASERKRAFEQSGDLRDLVNLANFLEEQRSWRELHPFAEQLFSRTRSLEDGMRLARTLNESAQYAKLFSFLSAHQDLVAQSTGLNTLWAWSLFREGRFADASTILKELAAARDDPNDRALRVNIAIASGNWDDLIDHSSSEWNNRENRTGSELLAAGQLAQATGGPHARDLITVATKQSPEDPAILAAAYFHATNAGWEQDPTISHWLTRAAELSGDTGPLKSISMQELLDRKPEWDKRESSARQQLNAGNLPIFGAAHLLNRSLIDFVLLPSLANIGETDPRRRGIVYAYSGARPAAPPLKLDVIALDLVAIITLARLDLLDTIVATYKRILIPHSTLGWLFQERQQATFHQPSRIKDAHLIRQLIAANALQIIPTKPLHDHALLKEVGAELAELLLAAKSKSKIGDGISRFVVRSAPVHRVGSLMAEEADLSEYADHLCSCQAVVAKLRNKGLLTLGEEQRATSFLRLHERAWPGEPVISDGAELYLDGLSVTYLMTVGVIDKLKAAGLTAYITETEDADSNRLIAFENLTDRQLQVIEAIRRALADGLKAGRILAAKSQDPEDDNPMRMHPTFSVLGMKEDVDASVVDDRFINRHLYMALQDRRTPILTSLDLLDDLARKGVISRDDLFAHRTYLRQAGFQLIPISKDELSYHLDNAPLADDVLVETAELRAIREALLKARMSKMLQIPTEVPWLHSSMGAIVQSIKRLWQVKPNHKESVAYAQWLVDLLDVRGWAASAIPGNERAFAVYGHASHVLLLMSAPSAVSKEARDAYYEWVDDYVLKDIEDTQPEVFAWLVDRARELVTHSVQAALTKLDA